MPYADLMQLSGYPVPNATTAHYGDAVTAALFADLTDDERDELLEYLALVSRPTAIEPWR